MAGGVGGGGVKPGLDRLPGNLGVHRIHRADRQPRRPQDASDEARGGRLAVGARHADDAQLPPRVAVECRLQVGKGRAGVGHDGRGHAVQLGQGALDDAGDRPGTQGVGHKGVAIHVHPRHGHKEIAGAHLAGIAHHVGDVDGAPVTPRGIRKGGKEGIRG
jgi:hypothetical protein